MKFTPELANFYLIELHTNQKIALGKISRDYPITRRCLINWARKLKIPIINHSKKLADFSYFEVIDTEEKAYWLGFIAADGCVMYRGNETFNFELSLKLSDKHHLQKLKKSLNAEIEVKTDSFRSRFCIGDAVFCKALISKGIVPRKSLILEFPNIEQVPEFLQKHFIRGYFDGDGCVNNPLYYPINVSILGTKNFLEDLLKISNIQKKIIQEKRNTNIYMFSISGTTARNFLNWIYGDATIFLDRKCFRYKLHNTRFNRNFNLNKKHFNNSHIQYLQGIEKESLEYLLKMENDKQGTI